jgi:hypothetical protein
MQLFWRFRRVVARTGTVLEPQSNRRDAQDKAHATLRALQRFPESAAGYTVALILARSEGSMPGKTIFFVSHYPSEASIAWKRISKEH